MDTSIDQEFEHYKTLAEEEARQSIAQYREFNDFSKRVLEAKTESRAYPVVANASFATGLVVSILTVAGASYEGYQASFLAKYWALGIGGSTSVGTLVFEVHPRMLHGVECDFKLVNVVKPSLTILFKERKSGFPVAVFAGLALPTQIGGFGIASVWGTWTVRG
jgi:hypothetical protein